MERGGIDLSTTLWKLGISTASFSQVKRTQIPLLRLLNVAIVLQNLADLQLIIYQSYKYKQISLKNKVINK